MSDGEGSDDEVEHAEEADHGHEQQDMFQLEVDGAQSSKSRISASSKQSSSQSLHEIPKLARSSAQLAESLQEQDFIAHTQEGEEEDDDEDDVDEAELASIGGDLIKFTESSQKLIDFPSLETLPECEAVVKSASELIMGKTEPVTPIYRARFTGSFSVSPGTPRDQALKELAKSYKESPLGTPSNHVKFELGEEDAEVDVSVELMKFPETPKHKELIDFSADIAGSVPESTTDNALIDLSEKERPKSLIDFTDVESVDVVSPKPLLEISSIQQQELMNFDSPNEAVRIHSRSPAPGESKAPTATDSVAGQVDALGNLADKTSARSSSDFNPDDMTANVSISAFDPLAPSPTPDAEPATKVASSPDKPSKEDMASFDPMSETHDTLNDSLSKSTSSERKEAISDFDPLAEKPESKPLLHVDTLQKVDITDFDPLAAEHNEAQRTSEESSPHRLGSSTGSRQELVADLDPLLQKPEGDVEFGPMQASLPPSRKESLAIFDPLSESSANQPASPLQASGKASRQLSEAITIPEAISEEAEQPAPVGSIADEVIKEKSEPDLALPPIIQETRNSTDDLVVLQTHAPAANASSPINLVPILEVPVPLSSKSTPNLDAIITAESPESSAPRASETGSVSKSRIRADSSKGVAIGRAVSLGPQLAPSSFVALPKIANSPMADPAPISASVPSALGEDGLRVRHSKSQPVIGTPELRSKAMPRSPTGVLTDDGLDADATDMCAISDDGKRAFFTLQPTITSTDEDGIGTYSYLYYYSWLAAYAKKIVAAFMKARSRKYSYHVYERSRLDRHMIPDASTCRSHSNRISHKPIASPSPTATESGDRR